MSVYVDDYKAPFKKMLMCHMVADTDIELDEMADKIGVKRKWKQKDHYDVCLSKRKLAIQNGAIFLSNWREFAMKCVEIRKKRRQ